MDGKRWDRRSDGWADGRMDGRKNGRTDQWTDGRTDGDRTDRWMEGRKKDGQMDGRAEDGRPDGWTSGRTNERTDIGTECFLYIHRFKNHVPNDNVLSLSTGERPIHVRREGGWVSNGVMSIAGARFALYTRPAGGRVGFERGLCR